MRILVCRLRVSNFEPNFFERFHHENIKMVMTTTKRNCFVFVRMGSMSRNGKWFIMSTGIDIVFLRKLSNV